MYQGLFDDFFDGKKLVFAYIPYYRCLYDVKLNFDFEYSLDYDSQTKRLSIKWNGSFLSDFWPSNISSVSVIAGKNGAGKTSIIQWLQERIFEGGMPERIQGIIVTAEGKRLVVYHDIEVIIDFPDENRAGARIKSIDTSVWDRDSLRSSISIRSLFYSGHFIFGLKDRRLIDEDGVVWDISDQGMLTRDCALNLNIHPTSEIQSVSDCLEIYEKQNRLRICKLLLDRRFHDTFTDDGHVGLRLPRFIVFSAISEIDAVIKARIQYLDTQYGIEAGQTKRSEKKAKKELQYLTELNNVSPNLTMAKRDEAEGTVGLSAFLYYALKAFCFHIIQDDSLKDSLKSKLINFFVKDYARSRLSVVEWVNATKNRTNLKIQINNDNVLSKEACSYSIDFFESMVAAMTFLIRLKWIDGMAVMDCVSIIKDSDFIPLHGAQIYADIYSTRALRLFDEISQAERFCNLTYSHSLQHRSTLSSGELAMLNLYSRVKYAFEHHSHFNRRENPCILFLDEAEIGFHPEWQRQFVNRLTQFISKISEGQSKTQIIYTTHSPITLSDMPKECVNLLTVENNESTSVSDLNKKETFGANVFELYGDSFFMEKGLIGEFASEKIMALNKDIEDLIAMQGEEVMDEAAAVKSILSPDIDFDELRRRINMIGDRRIKTYLHSRLDLIDPEQEIRRLKERLSMLESKINHRHEED